MQGTVVPTSADTMDNKVTGATVRRLNDDGEFSYFPGLSVIAFVTSSLSKINAMIRKLVNGRFACLPLDSYHVTFLGIVTLEDEQRKKKEWVGVKHVYEPKLLQAQSILDTTNEYSKPVLSFVVREVVVDKDSIRVVLDVPEGKQAEGWQNTLQEVLGVKRKDAYHITLAYRRSLSGLCKQTDYTDNDVEIKRELEKEIYKATNGVICVAHPFISEFKNLTDFRVWRGNGLDVPSLAVT